MSIKGGGLEKTTFSQGVERKGGGGVEKKNFKGGAWVKRGGGEIFEGGVETSLPTVNF